MRIPFLIAGAVLAAGLSSQAAALPCYTVLDRNDNVIYRDPYPPVDMSDQGAAERQRMRTRGEHLIGMDSDRCPALEFLMGNAGSTALNVDQVVAGVSVRGARAPDANAPPPASGAVTAPRPRERGARPAATPAR